MTRSNELVDFEDRELSQILSLARLSIGFWLFLMPRRGIRAATGDADPSVGALMATRGLGARDVAIAIGTMVALDRGTGVRGWLEAGAMADASDALSTLSQWGTCRRCAGSCGC